MVGETRIGLLNVTKTCELGETTFRPIWIGGSVSVISIWRTDNSAENKWAISVDVKQSKQELPETALGGGPIGQCYKKSS